MFQSPKHYWRQWYTDIIYLDRVIGYSANNLHMKAGISLQIIY